MAKDIIPAGQFGPVYPELPSVKKHRAPLASLTREQRQAYGLAVETAIRAKQRSELMRALPPTTSNSYPVGEALRRAHRARLQASVAKERRDRTPAQWKAMYAEAMADKRSREALPLAA